MTKLCGNLKSSVLVIGCFHGDEPQGKYLIEKYLEENSDTNIMFIPCLNEYGVQHNVRTNANGVDLNRNFPTKNWILSDKDNYYGGDKPVSESETKFVIELVEKIKPTLILTIHAPYKVVNYDGDALEISKKISEITGYPVEASIGYPTPGSFGTWAGIEKNIPTITLEVDEDMDMEKLVVPIFKVFKMLEKENRNLG